MSSGIPMTTQFSSTPILATQAAEELLNQTKTPAKAETNNQVRWYKPLYNPCHVEFILENMKIYLQISFLYIEMIQITEILPFGKQGTVYTA